MDAIEAMKQAAQQIATAQKNGIDISGDMPRRNRHVITPEDRIGNNSKKKGVSKKFSVSNVDNPDSANVDERNVNKPASNAFQQQMQPELSEESYDNMFYKDKTHNSTINEAEIARKYEEAQRKTRINQNMDAGNVPHVQVQRVNQTPDPVYNTPIPQQNIFSEPTYTDDEFVLVDEMPSKNLFYGSKPMIQPLKLKDLLIIENLDDENTMDSFSEIYHRRVKGVDPMDILSSDETYLLQYLRASTFPKDPYTWKYFKCDKCGYEVDDKGYKIDFTNMLFTNSADPEDIFMKHKEYGYYPIKVGKEYFQMYLRRRKHDYIYKNKVDSVEKSGVKITKPYMALLNIALITEIPGCKNIDQKIEKIGNLSKDESVDLLTGIEEGRFKTTTEVFHVCPNCGGKTVTPFPFRKKTFISSVQITKSTR